MGARKRPHVITGYACFTATCEYAVVSENWSYDQCVTVGPRIVATFAKRYGTHGTTWVISFLSTFSQHVVRALPSFAWQLSMSASMLGTLFRFPFTPSFFAMLICGVMPTSE